ncbi:MAG: hypothetical protein KBT33_10615 [Prevotellaceae bacterium]|nr:hypothetical protein [Candidatus Minthosoma equi]
MKRLIIYLLFVLCVGTPILAQRVTATFRETPLPEVLLEMERQCEGVQINFIYDDLKNYRVTQSMDNVSLKEAIHTVVGSNPVRVVHKKNKYYLSIVPTPKLKITGKVQDGFLHRGVPGLMVSLCRADSTEIMDSLPMTSLYMGNNELKWHIYSGEIKAQDKQYLVHTQARGYGDVWQKVNVNDQEDGEVNVPDINMLKVFELKEVEVVATKVKMFWKGDTLVYDATAFQLPDGSMLDALIRQLPGVELKNNGEIFVNGRKVDELLLGARSFMHGNKKVLMENLPYYTVKNIKVYEKASDKSEYLGYDVDPKKYVMDVNLKDEYQMGYIANMEAAAGTNSHWLGRTFLLSFNDQWRYTLLANANNVNENRHIWQDGNWSPQSMPSNRVTTHSLRGDISYKSKDGKVDNSFSTDYQYTTTHIDMHSQSETFLNGMTPHSSTKSVSKNDSRKVELFDFLTLKTPFFLNMESRYSYEKVNGNSWSDFHHWSDTLAASRLMSGMDVSTLSSGYVRLSPTFTINREKKRDLSFWLLIGSYVNKVERASKYQVDQQGTQHTRFNTDDYYYKWNQYEFNYGRGHSLPKDWRLGYGIEYICWDNFAHDNLYHPDTLSLPSQLESFAAIMDPSNSYDYRYTKHTEKFHINLTNYLVSHPLPGITLNSQRFDLNLDIPIRQHRFDYQRGVIDTLARYNAIHLNPRADFKQKFGKDNRNEVHATAHFTTHDTNHLLQAITFHDDSQPLIVRLGNPDLKARQTTGMSFDYANHNGPHRQEIRAVTHFEYNVRDIAESLCYNTVTGVYTYQPINVRGGYNLDGSFNYSRNLGKKNYWSVQSNANATLHHSVDHTMFSGETESHLNAVNTLTVSEKAYIQYNKNALNIRAIGSINWRHSKGKMLDFETLNAFDYQYGMNGYYTIPTLKTTVSVNATMYSRRGYGSSELNTDDFVLNASLSQSLFKGKLIARIEAFDLLHQLSNTQYEVNAQGRTITWYRSLPHYVMAHLVYHWNKNPKKK